MENFKFSWNSEIIHENRREKRHTLAAQNRKNRRWTYTTSKWWYACPTLLCGWSILVTSRSWHFESISERAFEKDYILTRKMMMMMIAATEARWKWSNERTTTALAASSQTARRCHTEFWPTWGHDIWSTVPWGTPCDLRLQTQHRAILKARRSSS